MKRLVVFALLLTLVGAACSPSNTNDSAEYTIDGVVAVTDVGAVAWNAAVIAQARAGAYREEGVNCAGFADETFRSKCYKETLPATRRIMTSLPCNRGIGSEYSGLYQSAQVVVSDGSGNIVGLGELVGGHAAYVPTVSRPPSPEIGIIYRPTCIFEFTVEGLPPSDFYSIDIPGQNPVAVRYADLEAANWEAELLFGFNSDVVLGPVDAPPPTAPPEPNP